MANFVSADQWNRLGKLLDEILPGNRFYADKLYQSGLTRHDFREPGDWAKWPFTTKAELLEDQERSPPYGRRLTYPVERYTRLHQTSGTQGTPLRWLDTPESWGRLLGCWQSIFDVASVVPGDRLFFPFSFGPFLGFWTAFEAAHARGCLCLPAGGLSSGARLRMLLDNHATAVLTTPTYALHLAEVAREHCIILGPETPGYQVRALIVAGEPGGSIPATRARIESLWHARVLDHSGMTEVGPMSIACPDHPGTLHVLNDYIVEVIDAEPSHPQAEPPHPQPLSPEYGGEGLGVRETGTLGELVVTNLHRWGSPLLRYRTGDLVRLEMSPCPCGRSGARLLGGILGRTDDMVALRGNNLYPSALEGVIRRFADVAEYRVRVDASSPLAELRVEIEPVAAVFDPMLAERIAKAIRDQLLFRAEVTLVPRGSLPRFEMKAKRFSE